MPSNAVPLAATSEARPAASTSPASPVERLRRPGGGRSLRPARNYLLIIGLALLAVWLVLVFGRALTQLNEASERAAAVSAESAALQARLEAGQRELELVQTDSFQSLQARSYGLGAEGERAFGLEADAPPPPPIVPLGTESATVSRTPLEAWLGVLFGP